MIGRIVRSADFERVLGIASRHRTQHFALHFAPTPGPAELSTSAEVASDLPVDESKRADRWFGVVVPKRHAKRSVTRTLLKRQMRSAARRHVAVLSRGWWVLRLKSPFDPQRFESASSEALRAEVHRELDLLLGRLQPRLGAS